MSDLGFHPGFLTSFSIMFLFTLSLGNNSGSLVGGLGPDYCKTYGSFSSAAGIYILKDP